MQITQRATLQRSNWAKCVRFAALAVFCHLWAGEVQARLQLATPDAIEWIALPTGGTDPGCGFRADFAFPDMVLRVELHGRRVADAIDLSIRVFSPSSVTPSMRDIWFKTPALFTLGRFKPGMPNAKGFLESRGQVDLTTGLATLREIAAGNVEVSFIFDGPLPHSRVPVRFPEPMPETARAQFQTCVEQFGAS